MGWKLGGAQGTVYSPRERDIWGNGDVTSYYHYCSNLLFHRNLQFCVFYCILATVVCFMEGDVGLSALVNEYVMFMSCYVTTRL